MIKLRLIFTFYRSFAFFSSLITVFCSWMLFREGLGVLSTLIWIKIAINGLIIYLINTYKRDEYAYYQNLGFSKQSLWIGALLFDLLIFIGLNILALILS